MSRPANAEKGSDGAADALRKFIAKPIGARTVPTQGWRRIDRGSTANFTAPYVPEGPVSPISTTTTPAQSAELVGVSFAKKGGKWKYQSSAFGCTPTVERRGATGVDWALDPAAAAPLADATSIPVLVRERVCTGGAKLGERLLPPEISYSPTHVKVTYYARPIPHKKGQFFTCPGVPAEHVTLRLTQPLGTRGLLDGSTLPPHAPTADSSWTFR